MHLTSQLVERNLDTLVPEENEHLLVLNPPESDSLDPLNPKAVVTCNYRVYQSLGQADYLSFGFDGNESAESIADESRQYDSALVFMPKSKDELAVYLDYARFHVKEGGELFVVGAKKEGVSAAEKQFKGFDADTYKVDSAKHCQLWSAQNNEPHQSFDLASYAKPFTVKLEDQVIKLVSLPGVFSHGKLDKGTDYLLQAIQQKAWKAKGRTLDFGCGAGILGIKAKLDSPEAELICTDINWFALQATKMSAEVNNVKLEVTASDGWNNIDGRFDTIITNPPFHQGIATEYQTSERFVQEASKRTKAFSRLLLVANTFLKYEEILEHTFKRTQLIAESNQFKVVLSDR